MSLSLSPPYSQWLEIPPTVSQTAWQHSQFISIAGQRLQAYCNQVSLQVIQGWLEEHTGQEAVVDSNPLVWELVNGCAINLGSTRIIIIPTEALDYDEFQVSQEWVDLPSWMGDYYLAVAIDPNESALLIWGYATHHQLVTTGRYDARSRTYGLEGNQLIQDMAVFWVMQQLGTEITRAVVPAVPALSTNSLKPLIERLADPAIALPRLELSLTEWGALLENADAIQQLCDRRQQNYGQIAGDRETAIASWVADIQTANTQLGQWLQNTFATGWQTFAELLGTNATLAFSFREAEVSDAIQRGKRIHLASGMPDVFLLVHLQLENDQRRRIWLQVLPTPEQSYLPAALKLTLRSATGEVIQSVQTEATTHYIQLRRFKCAAGTQFQLEFELNQMKIAENFIC